MFNKISEQFEVKTIRPANNPDSVSIAELAQFTDTEQLAQYPIARAYDNIARAFWYEIDEQHPDYYVDFNDCCAVFKDGSSLKISYRCKLR